MIKLCYRGNTYYRLNNQINPVNSELFAQYRGKSYRFNYYNTSVIVRPYLYQYRGVTYLKTIFQFV